MRRATQHRVIDARHVAPTVQPRHVTCSIVAGMIANATQRAGSGRFAWRTRLSSEQMTRVALRGDGSVVALDEPAEAVDEASNDPSRLGIRHVIVLGIDRDVLVIVAEGPHRYAQGPVWGEKRPGVPNGPTTSPITHHRPPWPRLDRCLCSKPSVRSLPRVGTRSRARWPVVGSSRVRPGKVREPRLS